MTTSRSGARPATPGARGALEPKTKQRRSPEQVELEKLRRRNERLEAQVDDFDVGDRGTHALLELRRPNRVWSWDITKLQGPTRGVYFELFVIIDIFSRYAVGWMVSLAGTAWPKRSSLMRSPSRASTVDQLTLHAERATSMASKEVSVSEQCDRVGRREGGPVPRDVVEKPRDLRTAD